MNQDKFSTVLTIIAPPGKLNEGIIKNFRDIIGGNCSDPIMLSANESCDIFFNSSGFPDFSGAPQVVDFIIQENIDRRKKLLISDMDSTIITIECIDEVADFCGVKEKVSAITERAMNGEIDFKEALKERVMLLKGMPVATLETVYKERLKFMAGAKELVATMRKGGARCVLVSGGFTFFTAKVRDELKFNFDEANIFEVSGGRLTGYVREPILDKDAKLESLKRHQKELNLRTSLTMAIGDGANDLPMLLAAGLGVAYHAKPSVKKQVRAKIDVCDLTSLLYAQGYQAGNFNF